MVGNIPADKILKLPLYSYGINVILIFMLIYGTIWSPSVNLFLYGRVITTFLIL